MDYITSRISQFCIGIFQIIEIKDKEAILIIVKKERVKDRITGQEDFPEAKRGTKWWTDNDLRLIWDQYRKEHDAKAKWLALPRKDKGHLQKLDQILAQQKRK